MVWGGLQHTYTDHVRMDWLFSKLSTLWPRNRWWDRRQESPRHSERSSTPSNDDIEADRVPHTAPVQTTHRDHSTTTDPSAIVAESNSNDQTIYRYSSGRTYALLTGNCGGGASGGSLLQFVHTDLKLLQDALGCCNAKVYNPCLDKGSPFVTRSELFEYLEKAKEYVVENKISYFMFYFTGHGDNTGIILSGDRRDKAEYEEIIYSISSLDVPKVLIFDCCRLKTDKKTSLTDATLPADCHVVFACMDDSEAWGCPKTGSYFTHKLANALKAYYQRGLSLPDIITQAVHGTRELCNALNMGVLDIQNPMILTTIEGQFCAMKDQGKNNGDITQLGAGINVLIIHAPDPLCASDCVPAKDAAKDMRIKHEKSSVIRLAFSLEQRGFSVLTELDANPDNMVGWYISRIEKSRFVLLVYSPALDHIFSSNFQSSDLQVNLIRICYNTICNTLQQNPDTDKFIPIVIDSAYANVGSFFSKPVYYAVQEGGEGSGAKYKYESLICKMAAIDVATAIKPNFVKSNTTTTPASEGGINPEADPGTSDAATLEPAMEVLGTQATSQSNSTAFPVACCLEPAVCCPQGVPPIPSMSTLQVGQGVPPLDRQVGQGMPPLDRQVGQGVPPLDRLVDQGVPPLDRQVGQGVPPLDRQVGQEVPPLDRQVGQGVPPLDRQVGQRVPPLDRQVGQGVPPLDRQVGQEVLRWLSEHIREWKLFARYLKCIRTGDINRCADAGLSSQQQCFEMLKIWHARNPSATYKHILEALEISRLNKILIHDFSSKINSIG